MHGIAQGFIQGISGGNAGQSFLTAAISSIAAGGYGMLGGVTQTGVGQVLFGTVAGGVTARLQGGNFWEGAAIGLTVSGLNHAMHQMDGPDDPPGKKAPSLKEANKFYNNQNRGSNEYLVDASSVDLNFVDTTGWGFNEVHTVQTLYSSKNGLIFGKLNLQYKGNNQVKIMDDVYDFNLEFSNPLKFSEFIAPRNIFTAIGQLYAGSGNSFTFKFLGLNTIHYAHPPSQDFRAGSR